MRAYEAACAIGRETVPHGYGNGHGVGNTGPRGNYRGGETQDAINRGQTNKFVFTCEGVPESQASKTCHGSPPAWAAPQVAGAARCTSPSPAKDGASSTFSPGNSAASTPPHPACGSPGGLHGPRRLIVGAKESPQRQRQPPQGGSPLRQQAQAAGKASQRQYAVGQSNAIFQNGTPPPARAGSPQH